MMELCKSESEEEDVLENENKPNETQNDNSTSNFETTQSCTQDQDGISSKNDKLYDDLFKINNEPKISDHIDSNIHNQNCEYIDLTDHDLSLKKIDSSDHEIIKEIDISNMVADEKISQLTTLTVTNNEFPSDLPPQGNTSAEICLVYNDSLEENETDVNLENEVYETNGDNMGHHVTSQDHLNNEVTVINSELTKPENSHLIFNDSEKQISTEDFTVDSEKPFMREIKEPDEDAFSDDDVNMEDIDKLIENAEIIQGMYLVYLSLYNCLLCNI